MKFTYTLNGIGWADVHFELDGKSLYLEPSYLTDALNDLVEGLISIIPGCVPGGDIKETACFDWNCEPWGVTWSLTLLPQDKLHIKIYRYKDIFLKKDPPSIELDSICDLKDFVAEVVNTLEEIIKQCGFVGYRFTWHTHSDFPISGYFRLKHFLENGAPFPTRERVVDGYIDFNQSDLRDELRLLLSLLESTYQRIEKDYHSNLFSSFFKQSLSRIGKMLKVALCANIFLSIFGFFGFGALVVNYYLNSLPNGIERPNTLLYVYWTLFSILFLIVNYPIAKRITERRILYSIFYYIVACLIVVFPYLVQYF